ncbi:ABC transporter substrate-binding protein [Mariluticola halotolerans]|uniref:ABC transporter substrate-binding protein n=1 Tax=Mariluticola halotolerans TaxID=2909283 RepID=UPI003F610046
MTFAYRVSEYFRPFSLAVLFGLATALPIQAADFDLDALIAAAKAEPPITVYDSTGKIVSIGENFTAKYGIQATGQKVSAKAQLEMIIREAQANNVQGDVVMITDAPAAIAQLIPQGFVESYLPGDMVEKIDASYHNPLTVTTNANLWVYNSEVYDSCPVSNMWELTQPEWSGRVAIVDPLLKGTYTDWFSQMAAHGDDAVANAYADHFGKPLATDQASATAAWVKAFGENGPLVTEGDDQVSEAVGAKGQAEPFFGLMSSAKFRDIEGKDYALAVCKDMAPWVGWTYSKLGLIASGTDSPNAAKLFIHFVLTEEGIAPQMADGKVPTNSDIQMPDDEPSGLASVADKLFSYNSESGLEDFDTRQDWQDFWRLSYRR